MIEVQQHGNTWMVVRLNSEGVVGVIRSFRKQAAAVRLFNSLHDVGAV